MAVEETQFHLSEWNQGNMGIVKAFMEVNTDWWLCCSGI